LVREFNSIMRFQRERVTNFICLALFAIVLWKSKAMAASAKPNIVFILADDLGYGDIGVFGQQKIRTPHLDRLAREGMKLTQVYAGNAVCAPSRCVLMTGKHPGHAYIRDNRELKPEGQEPLPAGTVTLPSLLQSRGYVTGAFGKWGLGGPGSSGDPLNQGFNRFFGFNCQRVAHNYFPTSLWDNDRRLLLKNADFPAHQKFPTIADPNDPNAYRQYKGTDYAPDLIMEQARLFIKANRERPFFAFIPTTVPHLALQVPDDSVTEYQNSFPETPYLGERGYLPHRQPRAAYAATVTRLDREIGRIMQLLADLKLDERTIVIFSSDNGPLYDRHGGTDCEFFQSAGPFRGRKGSLYEGGVRVPTIVRWKGRIKAGTTSDAIIGFEDWLPTLLELSGAKERVASGTDGISFTAALFGKKLEQRPFLYREFPAYGGQQSLRVGDWKAVRQKLNPIRNQRTAPPHTELYNLRQDIAETTDVSAQYPEIVARLEKLMSEQHVASPQFPFSALDNR
jgi:arylsulfatase A